MSSTQDEQPYLLSYRRDEVDENRRLDSQHDVIKHAILDDQLIHPSIRSLGSRSAIADLGCGTGVWLDDVANTFSAVRQPTNEMPTKLVGFDMNAHAFNPNPAPGVQLVEHDCIKPFDAKYIGEFDLVNIRGLAYALPKKEFSRLVENAIKLLSQTDAPSLQGWLAKVLQGLVDISSGLRQRHGSSKCIRTRPVSQKRLMPSTLSVRSVISCLSASHPLSFDLSSPRVVSDIVYHIHASTNPILESWGGCLADLQ